MTYQVEEAQSEEAEGDGSVEVVVVVGPADLGVLVQAWEGTGSRLRACVRTPPPLLQALGLLGGRWLEEVDHGEVGDLPADRPLVGEPCKGPEVAVDQAVEVQGEGAGHVVRDRENP